MPPEQLLELRRQLSALVDQARALNQMARNESRAFTEDEQTTYDGLRTQMQNLQAEITRAEELNGMGQFIGDLNGNRPNPEIGMSDNDVRSYSLVRAIRAAASNDWRGAELEREASDATAQRLQRDANGFFIPFDWMVRDGQGNRVDEQRTLNAGTPTAGGNTVANDLLAQSFIELLRNAIVVRAAGATVLTGLVGNFDIPKQTGGATATWIGEDDDAGETEGTIGQIGMTPTTVSAFTEYTRRLLLQSSIDIEQFVRNDLAIAIALAVDYAALFGDGTGNQPLGVVKQTGVSVVEAGANGAAPTWADIVSLETEIASDNALMGSLGYITNAAVRGKLKTTLKSSGVSGYIWENGSTPLNGHRTLVSNQVPKNLTKGTGTNLSAILFGNWRDLLIGFWSGLDILVDPYSNSKKGRTRVVAMQDCDIAIRHPESFSVMLDAKTI